jgi:hypothetical protein
MDIILWFSTSLNTVSIKGSEVYFILFLYLDKNSVSAIIASAVSLEVCCYTFLDESACTSDVFPMVVLGALCGLVILFYFKYSYKYFLKRFSKGLRCIVVYYVFGIPVSFDIWYILDGWEPDLSHPKGICLLISFELFLCMLA